jgi:riboflavin kinase/FMN adenylyltransferase
MKIITDYKVIADIKDPIAAALGYFDGLHLGHQMIIDATKIDGYKRGIITFKNQPAGFIAHTQKPTRLMTLEDKIEWMEKLGTEYLFLYDFTDEIKNITKDQFIEFFLKRWNVKYAVAGFNFHFGKNKEGDTDYLRKACAKNGIETCVVPPVTYRGEVISSTLIKNKLYAGDVETAAGMLGRPFYLRGEVITGKKLGRTIGIPTANIKVDADVLVPKWGVYQTRTHVNGCVYQSITNIGNNPTIAGDHLRIETHLLDFDQNIYDQDITIEFVRHIRDEIKFDDIALLKNQIMSDIAFVRNCGDGA